MSKKILLAITFLVAIFIIATPVFAQFGLDETAQKAQYSSNTDIYGVITTVVNFVLGAVGIIFLAVMFYAGLRWMTARGDEEKVTKAKDGALAAIIGLILVTASYGIARFVLGAITK